MYKSECVIKIAGSSLSQHLSFSAIVIEYIIEYITTIDEGNIFPAWLYTSM